MKAILCLLIFGALCYWAWRTRQQGHVGPETASQITARAISANGRRLTIEQATKFIKQAGFAPEFRSDVGFFEFDVKRPAGHLSVQYGVVGNGRSLILATRVRPLSSDESAQGQALLAALQSANPNAKVSFFRIGEGATDSKSGTAESVLVLSEIIENQPVTPESVDVAVSDLFNTLSETKPIWRAK
jgi:hypothetical protein